MSIARDRYHDYCPFCGTKEHTIKKCKHFFLMKRRVKSSYTKKGYINSSYIDEREELGYCAAGVLPYFYYENKIYLMVVKEVRDGVEKINFIGGKKESVYDYDSIRPEYSIETAYNEFFEETETFDLTSHFNINQKELLPSSVLWHSKNKYVLYSVKFDLINFVDEIPNSVESPIKSIVFITLDDVKSMLKKDRFHSFTIEIINDLMKLENNLEDFFPL